MNHHGEFNPDTREASLVNAQALQGRIILRCMNEWLTFKRSNRNKRTIIELGAKIFDMLVKYKASPKTSLQIIQTQTVVKPDLDRFVQALSEDEQAFLSRIIMQFESQAKPK